MSIWGSEGKPGILRDQAREQAQNKLEFRETIVILAQSHPDLALQTVSLGVEAPQD